MKKKTVITQMIDQKRHIVPRPYIQIVETVLIGIVDALFPQSLEMPMSDTGATIPSSRRTMLWLFVTARQILNNHDGDMQILRQHPPLPLVPAIYLENSCESKAISQGSHQAFILVPRILMRFLWQTLRTVSQSESKFLGDVYELKLNILHQKNCFRQTSQCRAEVHVGSPLFQHRQI